MKIAQFEEMRTCDYGCCDLDYQAIQNLNKKLAELSRTHKIVKVDWHSHFFTFELIVFYEGQGK